MHDPTTGGIYLIFYLHLLCLECIDINLYIIYI